MICQQFWARPSTLRQTVGLAFYVLAGSVTLAQYPINNPVKTNLSVVNPVLFEWTDSFKWKNVRNARAVNRLLTPQNVVDSTVFAATVQALATEGGVLYFPAGTYQFNFNLILPDGVVLRGASQRDSLLLTRFQFAKFNPDAKQPSETTVPKKIALKAGTSRMVGLVNLDIDRAYIDFRCDKPRMYLSNILLLGVRINNAAALSATVPTNFQRQQGHTWQRWPDRQIGSINLTVRLNALIAQCRVNDQPTDNFRQNGYLIDDGMVFDGSQAMFRFTDHAGIVIKTPIRRNNVHLTENSVQVSEGNVAFVTPKGRASCKGNKEVVISEKRSMVYDGIHARQVDYGRLYSNKKYSEERRYTNNIGDTLAYRLIHPDKYDRRRRYPLVLFFHDYDGIGTDNRAQLRQFIWQFASPESKKNFPCFIVAPQLPPSEKRWRSEGFSSNTWALQASVGLLDELIKTYNVDENRIYVIGINAGGEAAWDIAIRYPQKFAALVPLASFYRFSSHSARQLRSIPIWTFFGDSDEWFGKLTKQGIKSDLKAAGLNFKMTEIPNTGHRCWNNLIEEVPDFLPWLFTRMKSSKPVSDHGPNPSQIMN